MCEHGIPKVPTESFRIQDVCVRFVLYRFLRHSYVTCSFHLGGLPEPARTNTLNFKAELTDTSSLFSWQMRANVSCSTGWMLDISVKAKTKYVGEETFRNDLANLTTIRHVSDESFFSPTAWLLQVSHYFTGHTADRFARYPTAAPVSSAHQKQHTTAPLRTTPQLIPPPTSLSPQARPRQWWHRLSSSWAKLLNGRKINTTEIFYSAKRKAKRSHGWLCD